MKALDVTFSGLYTSVNAFSDAAEGALEAGDNIVLRDTDLIEPRRGYSSSDPAPTDVGDSILRLYPWNGRLLAWATSGNMFDWSSATGWSSPLTYGTFRSPDTATRTHVEGSGKSLYFTSESGTRVLDGLGNTVLPSGIPAPPYLTATTSTTGSTWLAAGASAAYRAVLCRYDANNDLIQSTPSPRVVVTNSVAAQTYAATKLSLPNASTTVTATSTIAHGLSVGQLITVSMAGLDSYFGSTTFTVSATPTSTTFTYNGGILNASGVTQTNASVATIGPAPVNVTVSGILPYVDIAGSFTFVQLYRTQSVGAGLTPSEEYYQVGEHTITPPELAASARVFTFDADVTPDTDISVPLYTNAATGTGQGENVQPPLARDLCLFNGQMLHSNTTEQHALELQLIGTAGLSNGSTVVVSGVTFVAGAVEVLPSQFQLYTAGTPAQNIETTARSLCRCISKYFANPLASPPGTRVAAYYVSGETDTPGLMVLQEQGVGGAAFVVAAGQDAQACWKPDLSLTSYSATSDNNRQPARVWWSPSGLPWSVPPDNWTTVGAESKAILRAVVVRSTVFFFKEDGLFTGQFGSDGVLTVAPFDPGLILLAPESAAVVNNQIFCLTNRGVVAVTESGVSPQLDDPIDRELRTVQSACPQYATAAFGVACETEGWYILALPVSSSDGACSQQYVYHAGHPSNGPTWTRWLITGADCGVFDPQQQGLAWGVDTAIYNERHSFTSSDFYEADGSPINCVVRPLPFIAKDPLFEKTFRTLFLSFRKAEFASCTVGFDSDSTNTPSAATKGGPSAFAWGGFNWGSSPWSVTARNFILRVDVPQTTARAVQLGMTLTIPTAGAFWQLQGLSLTYEPSTELVRRG